jgi:hypothetical protein
MTCLSAVSHDYSGERKRRAPRPKRKKIQEKRVKQTETKESPMRSSSRKRRKKR